MTDTPIATAYQPRRAPVQHRPGPPAKRQLSNTGGSPKVRAAIRYMIWGGDDGIPLSRQQAAKAAGIADVTLRNALANPLVLKTYNAELEVLRTGERPRSVHRIAELRDKAQSERVQLEAAKYLDGGDKGAGVTVNVGINANIAPGYQVVIPQQYADAAPQILHLARSTRNVLESQADVPTDDGGTP